MEDRKPMTPERIGALMRETARLQRVSRQRRIDWYSLQSVLAVAESFKLFAERDVLGGTAKLIEAARWTKMAVDAAACDEDCESSAESLIRGVDTLAENVKKLTVQVRGLLVNDEDTEH